MANQSEQNETPKTASATNATEESVEIAADVTGNMTEDGQEPSSAPEITEEEIRIAAYCRWEQRGGGNGCDIDDWICAEKELKK